MEIGHFVPFGDKAISSPSCMGIWLLSPFNFLYLQSYSKHICPRYQPYCKPSSRTQVIASASRLKVSFTRPTSAVRGWRVACFTPLWWRSVPCARYLVRRDFCSATVISAMACWRLRCASTKAISWPIYGNLCSQEGKNRGILSISSPNPQDEWKERSHGRLGFFRK